jgi:hypothetical protein
VNRKRLICLQLSVIASILLATASCGGGGSTTRNPVVVPPNSSPVGITISPNTATLEPTNHFTFVANVTGTTNTAVTWTVQEGTAGGSITAAGVYTAPPSNGTFHVIATSQADSTRHSQAIINVMPIEVSIQPDKDVLGPNGVRAFDSFVNTSLDSSVTWSVQEGSAGGTVTTDGTYTAPITSGTFHVIATSVQNPTRSAIADVTIVAHGFRPTGDMSIGRTAPTATLLPNGKVLITGGDSCFLFSYYTGECPVATTEIYDPATESFSPGPTMSAARSFHTATLLTNGKVLIVGGGNVISELYDPATNSLSNTGSTTIARDSHTATLLPNGKVLIVGGLTGNLNSNSGSLASSELYDPASGTFTTTGNLLTARASHTATLLGNGTVLITGGYDHATRHSSAELYDPGTGTFTATSLMTQPRVFHTAKLLSDGKVLITGGFGGVSRSAEIFNPTTGTFATTGSMTTNRGEHVAVRLPNSTVLIAGYSVIAETFDPTAGTFTQTGSMEFDRVFAAVVLLQDGRAVVFGGSDRKSAEIYK